MSRSLLTASLVLIAFCEFGFAQGPLRGKNAADRITVLSGNQAANDSDDKRQDVEGTIWEYKVFDHTEKDPAKAVYMTGKIRIKQSSIFAVGKAKLHNVEEDAKNKEDTPEGERVDESSQQESDPRSKLRDRLSQKMKQKDEKDDGELGGERIGDISKGGANKYKYQFDQDDDYPLSGLLSISPDPEKKNGVWAGNYEEFAGGKKVKRWRFEMRKIEE